MAIQWFDFSLLTIDFTQGLENMARTPLHDWHASHGGRIVDFAGWDMPVQYSTIVREHFAVRNNVGVFDISHMGRLVFTGPQAADLLDHVLTNDMTRIRAGQIRYSLVTNEAGGILDDVLVYRFGSFEMLVVNASNRLKIVDWIKTHQSAFNAQMTDETAARAMIALQGPKSITVLNPLAADDLSQLKYYTGIETSVLGHEAIVSRTGYTGEDGFEIIVASDVAESVWKTLLEAGAECGIEPAGLGSRDTLRLEAAMPLYGHEMDEQVDPYTAGLGFAVKLGAGDFIGKPALEEIRSRGAARTRIGLRLEGRRPAREGCTVLSESGEELGIITSGTFSPTLDAPIAMAYVKTGSCEIGNSVAVDIRGKQAAATVVELPFYKRS